MSWLLEIMRVVLTFSGITPPKPENERWVALLGLAGIALAVLSFIVFLRWMTSIVMTP